MTTKRQQHIENAVDVYNQDMKNHYRQRMLAVMEARRVYDECIASADMSLNLKTAQAKKVLLTEMREAQDTSDEEISR